MLSEGALQMRASPQLLLLGWESVTQTGQALALYLVVACVRPAANGVPRVGGLKGWGLIPSALGHDAVL